MRCCTPPRPARPGGCPHAADASLPSCSVCALQAQAEIDALLAEEAAEAERAGAFEAGTDDFLTGVKTVRWHALSALRIP